MAFCASSKFPSLLKVDAEASHKSVNALTARWRRCLVFNVVDCDEDVIDWLTNFTVDDCTPAIVGVGLRLNPDDAEFLDDAIDDA